ncbi:alanine dehydrogenase [Lutimonas saemankumensis]|uniref:alanine dehydrogenase n=1 Tax=Lutimonas saemankumensis TaxID=483016 RepID=UPI001CD68A4E|nr:alanine dehydrogenase [Lutimonas saemankumensis]MCA0932119.1 alanine dehydrogenase [Lutimonas saemankumensis]
MPKQLSPFSREELMPKPEMLEVKKHKDELYIGIPKETHFDEKRICLTPNAVAALTSNGHRIVVESGAGDGTNYTDQEYSEAGAKISYNPNDVFACSIILKVEPPSLDEVKMINPQSVLISAMQIKTQTKEYFKALAEKRITAIAFDYIQDNHGIYPLVKSLSEIAGTASVLIAAEIMNNNNLGNGLLLGNIGGVPPSKVVIIGAGTVCEFAARSALGLGASVEVFDNSLTKLRSVQHKLPHPIATSTLQPKNLTKSLAECDVAIGALRGKTRTPVVADESMVEQMKDGAVIIDVSIDNGGCFETSEVTTHTNPTIVKHGVIHYGVPNIPSRYSRTASVSISNIFTPYLLNIGDMGGIENAARFDKSLQKGMYFYHGILTNKHIADWFGLPFTDINLLIF